MSDPATPADAPAIAATSTDGSLTLELRGDWLLSHDRPRPAELDALLDQAAEKAQLRFDTTALGEWDSGLLTTLIYLQQQARERGLQMDRSALPEGVRKLLQLALEVPEREGARRDAKQPGLLAGWGYQALEVRSAIGDLTRFLGELMLSGNRLLRGRATWQKSQLWLALQEAGAEALPIVGLISFLIGMIFAFVGVKQLSDFGAGIYTADLVAVAMVREMAPIMTGIIMAGRTGAAYAAELGTMKVNEEIDALTTFGINPIDYLVLPRFIALLIMLPLLTLYASLLGIIGGGTVAVVMLETTPLQYILQSNSALTLNNLLGGLFKAVVYGAMVALTGTQQGMTCGSSAMAVGQATTRAVVMGIVLIVVSASLLTIIYINLGI